MSISEFEKGRLKGLNEAISILKDMEVRYKRWIAANPSIDGENTSASGRLNAVIIAQRALEKLKLAKPDPS